jgi:hypothetical protein
MNIGPIDAVPRHVRRRTCGKQRLNFATFITKERLNFPVANRYHVDTITHVNFYDWKTQRSLMTNIESRFLDRLILAASSDSKSGHFPSSSMTTKFFTINGTKSGFFH